MLVKVSVENFKSFDKAAELTMISSNKIRTNANHRLKIKSTQLLKYAVVYGANASGKTNLALFFKFFKDSVCNGIPIEATQMFCKNRKENKERESSFEIQITVGDKFYAYGFSAVLSRRKVTGEWLYELYQNGSAKCLFEREGSKRPVLNDGITLTNTEKNKFETYADDFEFTEVKVIDPETGEECPVGVQGEMCNRGYNTMKGYYKNPEATAEVLDENNFLHSGDLGIKDEDGNYRITGRIKDMIIRGGENIYPREIEEFLYKLDGVKDVQVAGIPSKKYGEAVGAFIILQEGVQMQEADVRDFCRNKISRYKIPKYIFFVNEFPMTGSGKIQKFRLKDLGLQLCKEQGIEII